VGGNDTPYDYMIMDWLSPFQTLCTMAIWLTHSFSRIHDRRCQPFPSRFRAGKRYCSHDVSLVNNDHGQPVACRASRDCCRKRQRVRIRVGRGKIPTCFNLCYHHYSTLESNFGALYDGNITIELFPGPHGHRIAHLIKSAFNQT
jgi:hypothetical protein